MAVSNVENASAFDGPLLLSLYCPRLHSFHRRQGRILLARKSESRHRMPSRYVFLKSESKLSVRFSRVRFAPSAFVGNRAPVGDSRLVLN
ncbi:hypothetical protein TNCV_1744781 [Trichonephila clavipes]|nr:hypothetical protein TNCV_1744781 [Trichonephila clavipes]